MNEAITGQIDKGLLVLLGIEDADTDEDIRWLSSKIINLRIFNDESGVGVDGMWIDMNEV